MADNEMAPIIYNESFEMLGVLDTYESLIWTERYNDVGEFELTTVASPDSLKKLKLGFFLVLPESDVSMIVETIKVDTNSETGSAITVEGRSLESILDRRIVWAQTDLNTNIESAVQRLLNDAIINPSNPDRKINGFSFVPSGDVKISAIRVDKQYTGDNLLDAIRDLCYPNDVGFRIVLDPNQKTFQFRLYFGKNRSYTQNENPFVIFSPNFDNLVGSNYTASKKLIKNVTQVKGDGEGNDRTTISIGQGRPTGLDRREMYVDARDISRTKEETDAEGNEQNYTKEEYENLLIARGREEMNDISDEKVFDGETDVVGGVFVYGQDFFMGDIVQVENEFELGDTVRVTELVRSGESSGFTVYPTFTSVSEKKEEVITR